MRKYGLTFGFNEDGKLVKSELPCIMDKKKFATLIASFNKGCNKPLKFGETSIYDPTGKYAVEVTPKYAEMEYEKKDTGRHKNVVEVR